MTAPRQPSYGPGGNPTGYWVRLAIPIVGLLAALMVYSSIVNPRTSTIGPAAVFVALLIACIRRLLQLMETNRQP